MKLLFFTLVLVVSLTAVSAKAKKAAKGELIKFKISAKGLPDKDSYGTTDGYVIVTLFDDDSETGNNIGKSNTVPDNENPKWSTVFKFDYVQGTNQELSFEVKDHDGFGGDAHVGTGQIEAKDFVEGGKTVQVELDTQGMLELHRLN